MTDLSRDGDTLGYPAFVPEMHGKKLLHNQRIGLVQFRNARLGKYFLYGLMKTNEYRSFILGGATGSTVRHTSPGRICDFKFSERDKEEITEFELVADGLHNLVELNLQQSRTLTSLRDTLLPRLMRGEVLS
jgi:type I restriction enzyme S subunit